MAIDSSMRYSSGYTIITLRGSGLVDIILPVSSYHYTIIGGGGDGGDGIASSTQGGGGGAGGYIAGWSSEKGSLDRIRCMVGSANNDSYITDPVHEFLTFSYRAYGGKDGDSTQTGHGGALYNSTYLGGDPNGVSAGGGAGWSANGSAAPSSVTGGAGGTGANIQFFDYLKYCCGGGGGAGVSAGGAGGTGGGGQGAMPGVPPLPGTDGTGGGGGGGYVTEAEPPESDYGSGDYDTDGNPIGGGVGYDFIYATGDHVIANTADFAAHMQGGAQQAASGTVVFVPSSVTVNLDGYSYLTIPAGVTIASNRGLSGSTGGKIKKTLDAAPGGYNDTCLFIGGANVRITGICIEGENIPIGGESSQGESGSYKTGESYLQFGILNGIPGSAGYNNIVVDNCELFGWGYAAFYAAGIPTTGRSHIHHCYIHHNCAAHMGYGVNNGGGDMLVEWNIFDYNRHSIAGDGSAGEKYTFRYNKHLGHSIQTGGIHVDVHENSTGGAFAGTEYYIYNNTIIQGSGTAQQAFVHIRGTPQTGAYIYNNLIGTDWGGTWIDANNGLTAANDDGSHGVIYQTLSDGSTGYDHITCSSNVWRGSTYLTNTGILWEQ